MSTSNRRREDSQRMCEPTLERSRMFPLGRATEDRVRSEQLMEKGTRPKLYAALDTEIMIL